MKAPYFFRDKPLFALEIGTDTVRLMQIVTKNNHATVKAYGTAAFSADAVKEGIVVDTAAVATAIRSILENNIKGQVNTKRIAMSVPAAQTFSRAINLPKLSEKEIAEAVSLEIEQYIPSGSENLYIDYSIIQELTETIEVLVVAVPKNIVDSLVQVAGELDLEPVIIETSLDSIERLFAKTQFGNIPSVLIKYEPNGVDISIVDRHIITTGTIAYSGAPSLEASMAPKSRPRSNATAIQNSTDMADVLATEIRRLARYYNERYDQSRNIEQIVVFGKHSKMPDLASKITERLRLPARASDPWPLIYFDEGLTPLTEAQKSDYLVVAGLAMAHPEPKKSVTPKSATNPAKNSKTTKAVPKAETKK